MIYNTEAEFHVETQVVQVDFSGGRSIFDKIAEAIRGKEIGMLGNGYLFMKKNTYRQFLLL